MDDVETEKEKKKRMPVHVLEKLNDIASLLASEPTFYGQDFWEAFIEHMAIGKTQMCYIKYSHETWRPCTLTKTRTNHIEMIWGKRTMPMQADSDAFKKILLLPYPELGTNRNDNIIEELISLSQETQKSNVERIRKRLKIIKADRKRKTLP